MSVELPDEIIRGFIEYCGDDLLACRLINRTWNCYANELCSRKMKAFPFDIAPHEAPVLYLKLKSFVPQMFEMLRQQQMPLPECLPLVILHLGIQKDSVEVGDLLQLNEYRKVGQHVCNRPLRSESVEQTKMHRTAALLVKKIQELSNPQNRRIINVVSAIILNKYARLSDAIRCKNELSAQFFLERAFCIPVRSLQEDFKRAQSTGFSFAKRIFEVMVAKDPLFTTSDEFNHALGHMAAQVKWVKACLLVAEEKRNSLLYGQTQEIIVEQTNVAYFENSTICLNKDALHEAVCADDAERVIELLDLGMPVNGRDFADRTPLMLAARKGSSVVFTLLLERGARILQKDMWGLTAMDWSAIEGRHDMLITSYNYAHLTAEYHHALFVYKSRALKYAAVDDPVVQLIEQFVDLQIF